MREAFRLHCLSEAVSPIMQMAGVEANEGILMRSKISVDGIEHHIPCLTGNALRHQIREAAWGYLFDVMELAGRMGLPEVNFMFHGGASYQGGGKEDLPMLGEFHRIFPGGRILGGVTPSQFIGGSMDVWFGRLVCEENRPWLEDDLPLAVRGAIPDRLLSCEHFLSHRQYFRYSATTGKQGETGLVNPESIKDLSRLYMNGKDAQKKFAKQQLSPMPSASECLIEGSSFLHGYLLRDPTDLEIGALLLAVRTWADNGGTIGGKSASGHGRLKVHVVDDERDLDEDTLIGKYREHAEAHAAEGRAWLERVFTAKAEKPKKGKGKTKAEEPDEE